MLVRTKYGRFGSLEQLNLFTANKYVHASGVERSAIFYVSLQNLSDF